jgi:hypothetical protein
VLALPQFLQEGLAGTANDGLRTACLPSRSSCKKDWRERPTMDCSVDIRETPSRLQGG